MNNRKSLDWAFVPSGRTPEKEKPWNFDLGPELVPCGRTPESEKPRPMSPLQQQAKKRGRPRKIDQFPQLPEVIDKYVRLSGFEAHQSRASEGLCGVRLEDIQANAIEEIPGLTISVNSVARTMEPPNKNRKASCLYRSLVPARVPKKRNNKRRKDPDTHCYNSKIKSLRDFAIEFSNDVLIISMDNKNKVSVGTLAISRRNQNSKIYPTDDYPDAPDHDFPQHSSKINPMGYMVLQPPEVHPAKNDGLGRLSYDRVNSGPSYIINRVSGYHGSTIAQHVADLETICGQMFPGKKICIFITDNGPDYTTKSYGNLLYYHRLWKKLDLDVLIIATFCPGHSAKNPIEHMWSVCNRAIEAVTLEGRVPNEKVIPALQKIDDATKQRKLALVLDNAMMRLCNYWTDRTYCGHPIVCNFKRCFDVKEREIQEEYNATKLRLKSANKINSSELGHELQEMNLHLDRRIDSAIFKKCLSCKHCSPQPDSTVSPAFAFLRKNPHFPCAIPNPAHKGHFYTFHDFLNSHVPVPISPDYMMQRHSNLAKRLSSLPRCDSCRYTFTSKADFRNHRLLFHKR